MTTTAASGKEQADTSDLRRMYNLLSRVADGVEPMLEVLRKYIISYVGEKVKTLGEKVENPGDFCEIMLESYSVFHGTIVEQAFQSDPKFTQTLDKAFRDVVNKRDDASELLAKYCDMLLRKGKTKMEGDDLDAKLKSLVTVFRYLDAKDIFQKFYSKFLARRLIYQTSVSDDSEAAVLSSLKQANGYEYTSKLQRMFTDMTVCEDLNNKLTEYVNKEGVSLGGVSFSVLVLTQGWRVLLLFYFVLIFREKDLGLYKPTNLPSMCLRS